MRKPRDFDAELHALADKAKVLKAKRIEQLGELVLATGAGALDVEILAGAMLTALKANEAQREAWHKDGAAFFRRSARKSAAAAPNDGAAGGETSRGEATR